MDKNNFFLDSPNLTDLVQVLINNICSDELFNVNQKLVLKKYDQSIKKINFILVDGLGSKNIENLDNLFTKNSFNAFDKPRFPSAFSKSIGFTLWGIVEDPTSFLFSLRLKMSLEI